MADTAIYQVSPMFHYRTQQKVFEIGGIKVGGTAFENPPVLIGTIFYHGHKIVADAVQGVFDKSKAEELIKTVEELSSKTRIPAMIDIVADYPNAVVKYLEFVSNTTRMPISIDSPDINVMKAGFQYAKEAGFLERVVYNSLTAKSKDDEYRLLQEYGVKAAIALLYTDKIMDVEARIKNLEAILAKTSSYGIEKILVDTFVIDVPSLSAAMRTMIEVKSRYGLPVGSGAHNAVSTQRKAFKERFGAEGYKACEIASNIATLVIGADFLLYGPIESAKDVFPATYTIYNSYKYLARRKESLIQI
ncbi:MAG: tetrahydromethanopterin S-methyltransferase subunit H [Ignisphaera sp.]